MKHQSCLIAARCAFMCLLAVVVCYSTAAAQVKPGDKISRANATTVEQLVSPGTYFAVTHGMEMHIVAPARIDWPPSYQEATEKYSGQVRLSENHRDLLGYVAGQPFPILESNDPDIAVKIM
ncbi:MAG TPA: DUF1329 domain-containing protein [Candidatus Binataceae bacterium]|nr:DUF1329 domain-containing protein [Candidatus Binataceae bacterium]